MPNKWIEFVKEWAKMNEKSYGCAISDPDCKQAYNDFKESEKPFEITPVKRKKTKKQISYEKLEEALPEEHHAKKSVNVEIKKREVSPPILSHAEAKKMVKEGLIKASKSNSGKEALKELAKVLNKKPTQQVIGSKIFEAYEPVEDIIARQFESEVIYYLTYITKDIRYPKDPNNVSEEERDYRKPIVADYIRNILETKKMDKALLKRIREGRNVPQLKEFIKSMKVRGK